MIVKVPNYIHQCHYYWYIGRMLFHLAGKQVIQVEEYNDHPIASQFCAVFFFDGKPIILDLRDDLNLPMAEISRYPDAPVYKANYSSEIWDNPPAALEYKITDEERKHRAKIRPLMLGRAITLKYNIDELACYRNYIEQPRYKIVSFTGTGIYRSQTEARLNLYDAIRERVGTQAKLVWYDRYDHFKGHWPEYEMRRKPYLGDSAVWANFNDHIRFISRGRYSLNMPGICVSQPFRFIDAILANRATISTKIWVDCWKMFPCHELPICAYFGTGDWDKAKTMLGEIPTLELDNTKMIEAQKQWYQKYFSADGMWANQFNSGAV